MMRHPTDDDRKESRIALVAGSAGLLGKGVCEYLTVSGWSLIGLDTQMAKLPGVEQHLCDITDWEALAHVVREITSCKGPIRAAINCAGINDAFEHNAVAGVRDNRALHLLDVNILGAANVIEACANVMHDQAGSIVSVASLYALVGSDPRIYAASLESDRDKNPIYEASKAAVVALTRHYAVRLAPKNIRVNSISPGGVANQQPNWFVREYESRVPLKRMAAVCEIASAIEFLISAKSSYLTGHNLVVDGGYSAW